MKDHTGSLNLKPKQSVVTNSQEWLLFCAPRAQLRQALEDGDRPQPTTHQIYYFKEGDSL